MRVNLCVNGTFRYPEYARFYAAVGALARFHLAHHRGSSAAALGLRPEQCHNAWTKHGLHAAAFRWAPTAVRAALLDGLCDAWQAGVLRRWTPADTCEVVIGGLADRVIARAHSDGAPVLGHAVTSHPALFRERVAAARTELGLRPEPRRPAAEARQRDEIAGCDAILVDSQAVARSYAARGVPGHRIAVVRPGFDPHRFRPRNVDAMVRDRFRVVCVGLLTPRKGQHVLIRAWRRLALPRAELLLVGTPGRDARAVLADRPDHVSLLGHIDHGALGTLLARADCLVLPSIEDGFGQAALEAMACGVPVILSDAVGAAELVRPGLSGLVVPARDVAALAAALESLYRDRDLGIAMGRAAAADVAALAGWPGYVAQVLTLHCRLAAGQPLQSVTEAAA